MIFKKNLKFFVLYIFSMFFLIKNSSASSIDYSYKKLPVNSTQTNQTPPQDQKSHQRKFALGLGVTQNAKISGIEEPHRLTSLEVVIYSYYHLKNLWAIRPGLRLGMTPDQDSREHNAYSVFISESDFKSTAEVSFLFRKYFIIPVITIGGGAIFRTTTLKSNSRYISTENSSINGTSTLPFIQSQISILVPIQEEKIEFGPFARYNHIFSDSRLDWYYGIEGSIRIF